MTFGSLLYLISYAVIILKSYIWDWFKYTIGFLFNGIVHRLTTCIHNTSYIIIHIPSSCVHFPSMISLISCKYCIVENQANVINRTKLHYFFNTKKSSMCFGSMNALINSTVYFEYTWVSTRHQTGIHWESYKSTNLVYTKCALVSAIHQ